MRVHYRLSWLFLNLIERLLFGFRVYGAENVPLVGGVIIASNHVSYCDPPVVGSAVPREVFFLAKEELFRNRAFAWLIKNYNAIPLRRWSGDIGAVRKAVALLNEGKAIIMFPEGTRSLSGRLLKPKPGIGLIASLASVPVVPTYVSGTNRLGHALVRLRPLEVRFAKPVLPQSFKDQGLQDKALYRAITEEVMRRIAKLREEANREKSQSDDT